jgi:hypothetical protein
MLLDEFNSNKAKPAGEKPEKVFLDDPFLAIKIILNPDSTHIFCQTRTLGVSVTGGREALLAVESKALDRSHMATVAGGGAARLGDSRCRFLLVRAEHRGGELPPALVPAQRLRCEV